MIETRIRSSFIFLLLGLALIAGAVYDMLFVQGNEGIRLLLGLSIATCFAAVCWFTRYPLSVFSDVLVAAWPLHVFTMAFLADCLVFHSGASLDQVVFYSLFAYIMYLLVPMVFLLDRPIWIAFIKLVALTSAVLAIPSFWGALGFQDFLGIPLRVKPSYSDFSGIIATAGVFEHAEGHAYQMAIGLICSFYLLRSGARSFVYAPCFLFCLAGLVISQGRAAIFGVLIAALFGVLPNLFRNARPVFVGTLCLVLILPFTLLPQLRSVPGLSGYFRIDRGLSGREEAWRFALSAINEKPWTGHGFMASTDLTEDEQKTLRRSGFSGAGTTFHNTFITKAVDLGWIVTGLYCLLYLLPLLRICRPSEFSVEQNFLRSMLILILATAIFRDYNIGGIRSTTMLGTIFLGVANLWHLFELRDWGDETSFAEPPELLQQVSAHPNLQNERPLGSTAGSAI